MKSKLLVVLGIALFIVSGCSTMSKRAKCACVGAAAGAAVGATTGGIIGHNNAGAHVRTEGAVIGAAAGALIGGVTGFLICREEPVPEPAAQPAPEPKPAPEKIVLNGILFDFDKSMIRPEYYPVLDEAASILQKHPDRQVVIEGYTCSIGTESYNLKLSERRASSVKKYLSARGINVGVMSIQGFGEANPVADNKTKQGRKMNRRVEFKVMDGE